MELAAAGVGDAGVGDVDVLVDEPVAPSLDDEPLASLDEELVLVELAFEPPRESVL